MTYPGGKANIYQWLINHIPPHQTFIGTHLGNCAVMRFKRPAQLNIGLDLDSEVIEMWQQRAFTAISDDGESPPEPAIVATLDTTGGEGPHHRDWRYTPADRTATNGDAGEPPASSPQTMVSSRTTINGDSSGVDPTTTFGGTRYQFINADSVAWLQSYPWTGSEFVYSDPPYLFHTRKQQAQLYRYEYTFMDHIRLLDVLLKLPCNVMISGYQSEIYDDILKGWRKDTIEAMTRGGTMATEVIWMNYPEPKQLHDYRYLGNNYRERERIKKKKTRWAQRWAAMDRLERLAILAAIQEAV